MSAYWVGVLTPFAIVAGVLGLWLLYALATWTWAKFHVALIARVDLSRNLLRVFGDDDRVQYSTAAQTLVDSLVKSPRLYVFSGLGWQFVIVRDYREVHQPKDGES